MTSIVAAYHFKHTTSTWLHLGIHIPLKVQDLCKTNFDRIARDCKLLIDKCTKMNMAWNDRMELVKTFLFPKFLYLFRSLPVTPSIWDFKKWQALLNDFIWAKKMHRIAFSTLRRKAKKGGFGIPDLYLYHAVSNLVTTVQILTATCSLPWMEIEWGAIPLHRIKTLLWQSKGTRRISEGNSLFLETSLAT